MKAAAYCLKCERYAELQRLLLGDAVKYVVLCHKAHLTRTLTFIQLKRNKESEIEGMARTYRRLGIRISQVAL